MRPLAAAIALASAVGLAGMPARVAARSGADAVAPSGDEDELARARDLYKRGRKAYDRGKYSDAAADFLQAYDLAGDPNLLFNLALVYDRMDDLERSLEYLERYRALAPDAEHAGLDSRIEGVKARIEARADEPGPSEPVDPPVEPDEPDPPVDPEPVDPEPVDTEFKVFNGTAIALTVTAGVLLATGAGLGGASLARTRSAQDGCSEGLCLERVSDDVRASNSLSVAADVTFAVGGAFGVAAIVVIALRAKKKRAGQTAWLTPTATPRSAGLTLRGRF